VVLVPLRRLSAAPIDLGAPSALAEPLAALIATHQPDLLLVMGRLAAQALLHTTEPLGKLRGRVHTLQGVNTIVTYDAQPLLRTPADKAKAWDDLCLGIATAAAQAGPGVPGG
jgi:DNA polymerase